MLESAQRKLPALLAQLGTCIPEPFVSLHVAAGLEGARLLQWLTPPEELEGKVFLLHVDDLGMRSRFRIVQGRFRPCRNQTEDLALRACAADFLLMLKGDMDADTLFFQRRLKITGDTELGLIVKNWLDSEERPAWLQKIASKFMPVHATQHP